MRKFALFGFRLLAAMALAGTTWAEEDRAEQPLRLELDLIDGSHIFGIPAIKSVPVQTSYAKMDVPLKEVRTIKVDADHEMASVNFKNGDKIKGTINLAPINLKTIFGKVLISIEHVSELRVLLEGGAIPEAQKEGLVLYYQFDRNEGGKVSDKSGKGNNGKVNGAQWTPQGVLGGACEFDGRESYIETPSNAALGLRGTLTLAAWVRIKEYSSLPAAIICKGNPGSAHEAYGLFVGPSGTVDLILNRNATLEGRSNLFGPNVPRNKWTHVAASYDGTTMRLYINGRLATSQPHEGGVSSIDEPVHIGKSDRQGTSYDTTFIDGLMDELRIYNRSLSAEEIRELYDAISETQHGAE